MNTLVSVVLIFAQVFYTVARYSTMQRGNAEGILYLSPGAAAGLYGIVLLLGVALFFRGETKTRKIAPVFTVLIAGTLLALLATGRL